MGQSVKKLAIFSFFLFIPLFLLSNQINYVQNDEYLYYRIVRSFLAGDFHLDPYMANTFYTQGLLSALWGLIFGIGKIPVLTAILSVAGFFVFSLTLNKHFKLSVLDSVLVGLLLFLSPLYLYSSVGFMTEMYFMVFLLVSIYFVYELDAAATARNAFLLNVFIVLSYFVRQVGVATAIASAIYFLAKRKFRFGFTQLGVSLALVVFHEFVFSKTPQMIAADLEFAHLFNFQRTFSLFFVIVIYMAIFTMPLVVSYLVGSVKDLKKNAILLFAAGILGFVFYQNFEANKISHTSVNPQGEISRKFSSPEFPYLTNIFGRTGFFPTNIEGVKYHLPGYFDLFNGFERLGVVLGVLIVAILLTNPKTFLNFETIFLVCSVGVLLIAPKIYDRYLLVLVPPTILMFVRLQKFTKVSTIVLVPFLALLLVLGYQYTMDNFKVNEYLWNRSEELVSQGATPSKIKSDASWIKTYVNDSGVWDYYFEYGEPNGSEWQLVERHKVEFLLNMYVDPYIYLYARK